MGIERNFNVAFVAEMALREKQIQQNYRPIIAVHKGASRCTPCNTTRCPVVNCAARMLGTPASSSW